MVGEIDDLSLAFPASCIRATATLLGLCFARFNCAGDDFLHPGIAEEEVMIDDSPSGTRCVNDFETLSLQFGFLHASRSWSARQAGNNGKRTVIIGRKHRNTSCQ